MSHTNGYITVGAFLFLLSTTSSLKCDDAGWRTKHEDCWGSCVSVTIDSDDTYTLTPRQIQSSCGDRDQQTVTTHAGAMPDCRVRLKSIRGVKKRVYCTNIRRPQIYAPLPSPRSRITQTDGRPSCGNPECKDDGEARRLSGTICKLDNPVDDADVASCPQCPPGTEWKHVLACPGTLAHILGETRICRIMDNVDWIARIGDHWHVHWKEDAREFGRSKTGRRRERPSDYEYTRYNDDGSGKRTMTTSDVTAERAAETARQSFNNLYLDYYDDLAMEEEGRLLARYRYRRNKPKVYPRKHQYQHW